MHEHETVCSSCGTDFSVAAAVWPDSQDFARGHGRTFLYLGMAL